MNIPQQIRLISFRPGRGPRIRSGQKTESRPLCSVSTVWVVLRIAFRRSEEIEKSSKAYHAEFIRISPGISRAALRS